MGNYTKFTLRSALTGLVVFAYTFSATAKTSCNLDEHKEQGVNISEETKEKPKLKLPEGYTYNGETCAGQMHGQGQLETGDAFVMTGTFNNNFLVNGKKTWADGSSHEGNFQDGFLTEGKKIWADGSWFQGNFSKSQGDTGRARIILKNGYIKDGNFLNNKFTDGKILFGDGTYWEGEVNDSTTWKDNSQNHDIVMFKKPTVIMPPRAILSGHCDMTFDVTTKGTLLNIEAQYCSHKLFKKTASKGMKEALFLPKVVDGIPVVQENAEYTVRYVLRDERGMLLPEYGD